VRTELDRPLDPPWAEGPAVEGGARLLVEFAPAKINLTLAVKGKRADGFHELSSLVAFASIGDRLSLEPGSGLSLEVTGEFAKEAGRSDANLVLRAAEALARRLDGLKFGAFLLEKRLPVAAGLGGGSADAAATLRLLARLNGLAPDCRALVEAAEETGSDVPVCLALGCRVMRGRGEILGSHLALPLLHVVLVNPGMGLETARVFKALGAWPQRLPCREFVPPAFSATRGEWLAAIAASGNDLEAPAIGLAPAVEAAKLRLGAEPGCVLARMTGSGATLVGVFDEAKAASGAARSIAAQHPAWWVRQAALEA
jgi:4-diphosphocytidyl-2-C-methyl-D-erythritol kinase